MYRCLNTGAVGMDISWEQCLPLAKAAGFEGVDVYLDANVPASHYREKLAEHGLKMGGVCLPVDFRAEESKYRQQLAAMPAIVKHAREVGAARYYIWIIPCHDTLSFQENFKFHVDRLAPAAKILADNGAALGLEFIGPKSCRMGHRYPFVRTMEQMLDLAAAVGSNVGLLLDCWHWHTSLGTVQDILTLKSSQVIYVHVNDAPPGLDLDQYQDLERRLPGDTGIIDIGGFLGALRQIGYDGPVVPEPFVPALKKMTPADAAQRVGQAMRKIWSMPPKATLPQTMKVVATGGKKAWLVDLPVPRPEGNQVVVKLHASPICGSNMHGFHADGQHVNEGHEGAGEVVAVAHSNLLKIGDRVVLAPLNGCGQCIHCRNGDVIFCKDRPTVYGNFAQYTKLADFMCVKLPEDIDYVHGSLIGCALGPAYEALKQLNVRAFDTVTITGLGPVGLGATALATFLGARVIAIDPVEYRRDIAGKLGAEVLLSSDDPQLKEKVQQATDCVGVRKGMDCSGTDFALRFLIDAAAIRGHIAIIGENYRNFTIVPSADFIRKGLVLRGCWHMNMLDVPDLFTFLRRAPQKADRLITHRFGFAQVQQAFDTFASRQAVKVILLPHT